MNEHLERVASEFRQTTGLHWEPSEVIGLSWDGAEVTLQLDSVGRALNLYWDLGPVADIALLQRLLIENTGCELPLCGAFAMSPDSDHIFFRARWPLLPSSTAAELIASIEQTNDQARRHLAAC